MHTHSAKGFSLLEMLLVVVIIGILAVAGGTMSGAAQPAAVKGTLNSLYGILVEARTVARTTGRMVTLTTSGHQGTLQLTFPSQGDVTPVPDGQALTTWLRSAGGTSASQYSGIDTNGSWPVYTQAAPVPDPLLGNEPAIAALFTSGTPPGVTGKLFTGADTDASTFSFDATGRANRDFYVYVGGMRNGASYPSAPVGLVLVTRASGVHAFYKPNAGDANVPWQRL